MRVLFKTSLPRPRTPRNVYLSGLMSFAVFITLLLSNNLSVLGQNTIQVKGRITNDSGQPVQNASVTVKGSSDGTTANENGDFSINAPSNGVLVVSAINYAAQEISIDSRQVIDVSLLSNQRMESEVIVVGYGTQRKKDVTGAVASVNLQMMGDAPNTNIASFFRVLCPD